MKALATVQSTDGKGNILEVGHVQNIQIFGDEVEVDVISTSPALTSRKN